MLFQHIGHAEFLIETESGFRIVTDPYDAGCGYPIQKIAADAVLVSHHHHDHDAVENLSGNPRMIDCEGTFTPEPGIRITAIPAWHDDSEGSKRGPTLLFLIETEGLRIAHFGDLGCALSGQQIDALGSIDVLMIPVGGFFTIDANVARASAEQVNARIILPMHYKTKYNSEWPISVPEPFEKLYIPDRIRKGCDVLRITKEDLECQPDVVFFKE